VAKKEGIKDMEKHKTGYKQSLTKQGRKRERKKKERVKPISKWHWK